MVITSLPLPQKEAGRLNTLVSFQPESTRLHGQFSAGNNKLPVLPETGIVDLGQLIEYNDGMQAYRGLVRSVRVSANFPTVVQQLEIETHA